MTVSSIGNPAQIHTAIAAASRKTGIDFNYLLGQAQVESGFRADARAATSSATGLYQFIEQSWLGVVKQHGEEHGLGWAAEGIRQTQGGRFVVTDPAMRQAILQLRNDPAAASLMAAEHASDNKAALEGSLGRSATGTDLYMAHFLGLGGARRFLSAMESNPDRTGASMFPNAARANRSIFYGPGGEPRSLSEIYQRFAGKLDKGAAAVGATGLASGRFDSALPALQDGVEVIAGNGAVDGDRSWVQTALANMDMLGSGKAATLDRLNLAARGENAPLRPTPETARLAYLMLASLGA